MPIDTLNGWEAEPEDDGGISGVERNATAESFFEVETAQNESLLLK
jgi:hypothetical protein